MRRKREVIEELLKGLSMLEKFDNHPYAIASQFADWLPRASSILNGVDMRDESDMWDEATKGIRFSDDYSLVVAMSTVKATLLCILNKLESREIFSTPYLQYEDVTSACKMSDLYVILHCYENSVRRFIESVFCKEFGDNWWEEVANNDIKSGSVVEKRKRRRTNGFLLVALLLCTTLNGEI